MLGSAPSQARGCCAKRRRSRLRFAKPLTKLFRFCFRFSFVSRTTTRLKMKRKQCAEGAEGDEDCRSLSVTSEEHIKKSQKVEDGAIDWKLYAEEIEQRLETKSSEEKKRGEAEAENTECQLWAELSHARAKLGQWHEALSAARKAGRSTFEVLLHLCLPHLHHVLIGHSPGAQSRGQGIARSGEMRRGADSGPRRCGSRQRRPGVRGRHSPPQCDDRTHR